MLDTSWAALGASGCNLGDLQVSGKEPKNRYLKIPVFELLQIVSFDHLGAVLEPIQTVLDTSWAALEASGCHLSDLQASAKEPKNRYLKILVFELTQIASFDHPGQVLEPI